jgi:hypothetical protein
VTGVCWASAWMRPCQMTNMCMRSGGGASTASSASSNANSVVSIALWVAANPEAAPTLTGTVLATQGQYRLTYSSISTSYWACLSKVGSHCAWASPSARAVYSALA